MPREDFRQYLELSNSVVGVPGHVNVVQKCVQGVRGMQAGPRFLQSLVLIHGKQAGHQRIPLFSALILTPILSHLNP